MKATVGTEPEEPWLIWTEERYGSVVDFTVRSTKGLRDQPRTIRDCEETKYSLSFLRNEISDEW